MTKDEITQMLELFNVDTRSIEIVQFAYDQGARAMLDHDKPAPAPYVCLTTTEIVDCATEVYRCDPNCVSENDIKFARHIERITLER